MAHEITDSSVRRDGQHDLKTGAPGRPSRHLNSAVVGHDDLLDERETQTGAPSLCRDERPKHSLSIRRRHSRAIVVDGHPHAPRFNPSFDDDLRSRRRIHAGFDGISQNDC